MPNRFEQILEQFPNAALSIRKEGPPTYRGENPHRIIIEGNPAAFRMLGQLLNMMADRVESKSNTEGLGWQILVDTESLPQLHLDKEHLLALTCDPDGVSPQSNCVSPR